MSLELRMGNCEEAQQRSDLPPGGSPAMDSAFLDWARDAVDEAVRAWADSRTGWGRNGMLSIRPPVNMWQLSNHMYKFLIGWQFPSGTGPTNSHRVRFLAIQFHLRRQQFEAEAHRYLAEKLAEADIHPSF